MLSNRFDVLRKKVPGFIVNRVQVVMIREIV